ncbi:MAG: nitrile hydratase subunit beta [Hyphomicrobiaceae bacterium]|nr:nitrile hydratase subunit beta [Hyphomicrobiaceae bacterium]
MDGIHDLGGRQGFGKVDVGEKEEAFHSDWEARAFAIVRAMSKPSNWTLDKFRFTREQIDPVNYLSRPYYDQWIQSYAALMVGSGVASVEELASGKSSGAAVDLGTPRGPESVAAEKDHAAAQFERPYDAPFKFEKGTTVRTLPHAHKGHTRLPSYVRGHEGQVIEVRGAFIFPDESAEGVERAEPLYTVAFDAGDLWPGEDLDHAVHIDLWESYLEPV